MFKVVAVLPASPHPFGETGARLYYVLIRELLKGGHRVVCLVATDESRRLLVEAETLLSEVARTGQLDFRAYSARPKGSPLVRKLRNAWRPFSELVYADGLRGDLLAEIRQGYDVLHLEQLWTGWVGFGIPRTLLNIHGFDVIDWEGRRLHTLAERKAWLQMRRATARIVGEMKQMRVLTQRLIERARRINPSAQYWVVPAPLDLDLYPIQPLVEEPVVGLLGSMHWFPSRSAGERLVTRIWPQIKRRCREAKLYVAGWNALKYLGHHLPMPDVVIEENLAHPTEFFSKVATMVYAPSRGSGMKIKVLEAMAYGVPVVTTWEGVEGIAYQNGLECWVEEDDDAIAARVTALLEDRAARQRMREAARALMHERYSPRRVVGRMLEVYGEIAQHR